MTRAAIWELKGFVIELVLDMEVLIFEVIGRVEELVVFIFKGLGGLWEEERSWDEGLCKFIELVIVDPQFLESGPSRSSDPMEPKLPKVTDFRRADSWSSWNLMD